MTITLAQSRTPLVLALDVGTSSVRAVLYDASGRALEGAEGRTPYQMTATADGGVEIDADKLAGLICGTIDQFYERARGLVPRLEESLCAVACSTFWHACLGVGEDGRAVTPLYNWSDTRSAPDAAALAERPGADWIHARTGVLPHASYYPAKILWLRRTDPALSARVARWMSIGEYLYLKIFGLAVCGVSMASGTGLFNPNDCRWDSEMLAAVGLAERQLSPLAEGDEGLAGMRGEFAARWPALSRVPWMPAVGDGAASNVGSGCVREDLIAINVGTSGAIRVCWPADRVRIPRGLWCYRASRRYALVGGALSNAGDVYAWCRQTLRLAGSDDEVDAALSRLAPDGHGLTVLPFFSGERSTGWADYARAAVVGMSLSTGPLDVVHAALESVCYRFAAIYDRLREEVPAGARIIASGAGFLKSEVYPQTMADVIGVPVEASAVPEASSRGAALLALEALGRVEDLGAVPTPHGAVYEPDPARHEIYRRGRGRQERLYELLVAPGPHVLSTP